MPIPTRLVASTIAWAQPIARAEPLNDAKKPSRGVLISRQWKLLTYRSNIGVEQRSSGLVAG
jgi:hypothetical protein